MDKKGKLDLLNNPAFLRYLENLPTHHRRILAVPDEESGEDKYIITDQIGNQPANVHTDLDKEYN